MSDSEVNAEPDLPTEGVTLREFFAAAALQGLLANPSWNQFSLQLAGVPEHQTATAAAQQAFAYADAMVQCARRE